LIRSNAIVHLHQVGHPACTVAGGASGVDALTPATPCRTFGTATCRLTQAFIYNRATDGRAPVGFAPIAIGLGLTLIHLIGIPVTNLSVNPARSTGPAVFVGGWALAQLWMFWIAPIVGALLAGFAYSWLAADVGEPVVGEPEPPTTA
jgi:aquaporin Z